MAHALIPNLWSLWLICECIVRICLWHGCVFLPHSWLAWAYWADSLASGLHLLVFDPCKNKQGVKDKCLRGKGENLFSSICLSMSSVTMMSFCRRCSSFPHGLFWFLTELWQGGLSPWDQKERDREREREGEQESGVPETHKSHIIVSYNIPRSLVSSWGLSPSLSALPR